QIRPEIKNGFGNPSGDQERIWKSVLQNRPMSLGRSRRRLTRLAGGIQASSPPSGRDGGRGTRQAASPPHAGRADHSSLGSAGFFSFLPLSFFPLSFLPLSFLSLASSHFEKSFLPLETFFRAFSTSLNIFSMSLSWACGSGSSPWVGSAP